MKKNEIICSLLLFITSLLVMCCFTIFNKHFVQHIFDKNNYYNVIYKRIIKDDNLIGKDYKLSLKDVKKDINEYISSKYSKTFNSKIELDNIDTDKIYNKYISFDNLNIKYINIKIYIIEIITIIMIFITGDIFMRTKSKTDINIVLLITSFILFITYGCAYFTISINDIIISKIMTNSLKMLLGYSIILFEISIFSKIKLLNKINNIFKKKK